MQAAIAVLVQQRFDLCGRFVPTLLEGRLTSVLRHHYVRSVQCAVADNLDARDIGNFLPDQFEDRAAKVPGNALVGSRALEPIGQKGLVETLTA
jgi:hypothetical protein